jgi:hypothetical protein
LGTKEPEEEDMRKRKRAKRSEVKDERSPRAEDRIIRGL